MSDADRAATGKAIVRVRAADPAIEFAPTEPDGPRVPGMLKGLIVPDALFDPLEQDEAVRWE